MVWKRFFVMVLVLTSFLGVGSGARADEGSVPSDGKPHSGHKDKGGEPPPVVGPSAPAPSPSPACPPPAPFYKVVERTLSEDDKDYTAMKAEEIAAKVRKDKSGELAEYYVAGIERLHSEIRFKKSKRRNPDYVADVILQMQPKVLDNTWERCRVIPKYRPGKEVGEPEVYNLNKWRLEREQKGLDSTVTALTMCVDGKWVEVILTSCENPMGPASEFVRPAVSQVPAEAQIKRTVEEQTRRERPRCKPKAKSAARATAIAEAEVYNDPDEVRGSRRSSSSSGALVNAHGVRYR